MVVSLVIKGRIVPNSWLEVGWG